MQRPQSAAGSMARSAAVIGGGPAGLMAAEVLARAGVAVTVYDQMPSVGRKLLMAGRGGLNLTHTEPLPVLLSRYGAARSWLEPIIARFPPAALIAWCNDLGQPTFIGSSARVFPIAMKASPLLRAWLRRLHELGVVVRTRHRWMGWDADGSLRFEILGEPSPGSGEAMPSGGRMLLVHPSVMVLAAGGASWPRLGSDAGWARHLPNRVAAFQPANCGFRVDWSPHFSARFAGRPLKRIAVRFGTDTVRGEAMITRAGIEGGVIYALSARAREAIRLEGTATLSLDLRPDLPRATLEERLGGPRGGQSLANTLRKRAGLAPEAIGLVQEALHRGATSAGLARLIKALPVRLTAPAAIERAISTAGGVRLD